MPRRVELGVTGKPLRECGSLGFAASGLEVHVKAGGEFTSAWCALGSDFLNALAEIDRGLRLGGVDLLHSIESPRLVHLGRAIFREAVEPGFCSSLFAEATAMWIVLEIARYNGARNIDLKRAVRGGLAPWQLRRLDEYIRAHMSDALTLHELAIMLGISVRQLSRAVRQVKGMGLHRWIAGYRIEEARRLLGESELQIAEIALRCGFQSGSAFSTAFRSAVGFTPTEYRRLGH
jgi:AraC family transcriptional regulator